MERSGLRITEVITRKKNWETPQKLRSVPAVNYTRLDTGSRTRTIIYTNQLGFQKVIAVNIDSLNCHLPGSTESVPQWTNCNFMCCVWDSQLLLPKVDALLYECLLRYVSNSLYGHWCKKYLVKDRLQAWNSYTNYM